MNKLPPTPVFRERHEALALVRWWLDHDLRKLSLSEPVLTDPAWEHRAAVFVTLRQRGRLRGCVGSMEEDWTIRQNLLESVARSALRDTRFSPVTPNEVPTLEIEISILSPQEPARPEDIDLGTHGIVIEGQGQRALFLPHVATREPAWDRPQLLENLCRKAGLPPDFWRSEEARLWRFTTEIINED